MSSDQPPHYGPSDIIKLLMPEVERAAWGFTSVWRMTVERQVESTAALSRIEHECGAALQLDAVDRSTVILRLTTTEHPLDVESYVVIDCVLRRLHGELHIVDINGSPREEWRTFR